MIEKLTYQDIGRYVKMPTIEKDEDGKTIQRVGRIKAFDNGHKHAWIVFSESKQWRAETGEKVAYVHLTLLDHDSSSSSPVTK